MTEQEKTGLEAGVLFDRADFSQLTTLLTEIASLHLALSRLLDTDHEGCSTGLRELHKGMDRRLEEACSLIWSGKTGPKDGPALVG